MAITISAFGPIPRENDLGYQYSGTLHLKQKAAAHWTVASV